MNIIIFLPHGTLGGAEQFLLQLAKNYLKRGNKIYVFFLTNKDVPFFKSRFNSDFIEFIVCPTAKERIGIIYAPFILFYKFFKVKIHLIISSHLHTNSFIGVMRKLGIVDCETHIARESTQVFKRFSGWSLRKFKMLYKLGYGNIEILVCQTEIMRKNIIDNLPWIEKNTKVVTIQNPINLDEIKEMAELEINIPSKPYIIAAGSLRKVKGFDILIKAFSLFKNSYPDLKLVILGKGELEKELKALTHEMGLSKRVFFEGWVDNVYPFFKNAEACVVSSRIEGFPNVLLQQIACNDTVVSTLCTDGLEKIEGLYLATADCELTLFENIKLAIETNNAPNRILFDRFLAVNSIDSFVDKIESIRRFK